MAHFGKKGLPILIDGLNDTDAEVRFAAVTALEIIGTSAVEAIPALEARLNDGNGEVRNAAPRALQAIDPARFKNLQGRRE